MNSNEFEIKMKAYEIEFNNLFRRINDDVIKFAEDNPEVSTYNLNTTSNFVDNICESGAWILDKINNQLGKKKGLKYKIRKALGFTYP